MRNFALIFLVLIVVGRSLQMNYQFSVERDLIETSKQRIQLWRTQRVVQNIDLSFDLEKTISFCSSEENSKITLKPNGNFEFVSVGKNDQLDQGFKNFSGIYSVRNGNIYFAWRSGYNLGHIIGFESTLIPKSVVFARSLFDRNKCDQFVL